MMPEKTSRILALDLLRGYFLVVIIIDHLFRFPSLFEIFTGRGQLWVSAAEGFFIISGLLVGYIYKSQIRTNPQAVFKKIWKRAVKLYLLSIGLTILFTAWGWILNSTEVKTGIWPLGYDPLLMFTKVFILQYVYGWADFLPFYAVFMFFAPICLWLISKKYILTVLILSSAVWVIRGNNFYLAWQTLFIGGILTGFYFLRIEKFFVELPARSKRILTGGLFVAAITTLLVSVFFVFGIWTIFRTSWVLNLPPTILGFLTTAKDFYFPIQTAWFDKNSLPPIRLFLSGLWFAALLIFFRKRERSLSELFNGVLLKFGQNSLLVYVSHGFILFPSFLFLPRDTGFLANTIIGFVLLVMVYGVVYWQRQIIENITKLILQILVIMKIVRLDLVSNEEGA